MKTFRSITMIALILLFHAHGMQAQSDQLTQQQKEQIKNEVKTEFDSIMARWQRMDVDGAMQDYSLDFVCFGSEGERVDFEGYKKPMMESLSSAASYKWTSYQQNFIVITKEIVVCAWDGKNELVMKSGDKISAEPSHYTFAFKKIEGHWKLSYQHFSGTFVTQKGDLK